VSNNHTQTRPVSYAEWSACLDLFESGLDDTAALAAMQAGTLGWTSGVAERFAERIAGVFNQRLSRCADRMARELRLGSDEVTLVRSMGETRRTLGLLHAVAHVATFPPVLQQHLSSSVKTYAARTQQSLEDSARQDRSGRIGSTVRNNSVLRYEEQAGPAAADPSNPARQAPPALPGTRRRNILA
jgi:hypothetical protein